MRKNLTIQGSLIAGLILVGCGSSDVTTFAQQLALSSLIFNPQPVTHNLGSSIPTFVVQGRDQNNSPIIVNAGTVEISLGNNPTGAVLFDGNTQVNSVSRNVANGEAIFSNVRVSLPGNNYTLVAQVTVPNSNIVLQATSAPFSVTGNSVAQSVVYLRSTLNLWDSAGGNSNVAALDAAFGAGNFTQANFETVQVNTLFQPGQAIFMDGGDNGSQAFTSFVAANSAAITNFVNAGGRVLLNAAENSGPASIPLPFDVTLNNLRRGAVAVEAAHPLGQVMTGSFAFTGSSFGHAIVIGNDLTPIIRDTEGPSDLVLAERRPGAGLILFGGMTTVNFHDEEVAAAALRANILRYLAGFPLVTFNNPGSPAPKADGAAPSSSSR